MTPPLVQPADVVAYDPRWVPWFEEIRDRLLPHLDGLDCHIEHVGSTAVPGLTAKPIIDVDVVVQSPESVPDAVARLEAAGYQHQGDQGIPGRQAFALPPDAERYHHLYVVVEGNKAHRDHVLLRDHLRTNSADRERYAARKLELAHLLTTDRSAYVDGKSALVAELIARAGGSRADGDQGRTPPEASSVG